MRPLESLPSVSEAIRKVEKELDGRGRVVIRYSGTESKVRVMVEGDDEVRVRDYARDLAELLRHTLGAAGA